MRLDHVPGDAVGPRQLSWWHAALVGVGGSAWVLAAGTLGEQAFLVVTIAVLSVLIGAFLTAPAIARRSTVAGRWAAEHGWSFDWRTIAVLGVGRNLMTTMVDGVRVASYETLGTSDLRPPGNTVARRRHLVVGQVARARFPWLTVVPNGPLAERRGTDRGLQLESAEFNARWMVQGDDPAFGHAFCHPRLMERLMRDDAVGLSVLVQGSAVTVHAPGPTNLRDLEARAVLTADLVHLVPAYLVTDYASPSPDDVPRRRDRRTTSIRSEAAIDAGRVRRSWAE